MEVGSNRGTCVTDEQKSLIESRVVNLKRLLSFVTAGLKNGAAATAPNSSAAAGHGSEGRRGEGRIQNLIVPTYKE